jgi:L-ascorbate metabolism protein UlaG (beta-lactamase superfamily)
MKGILSMLCLLVMMTWGSAQDKQMANSVLIDPTLDQVQNQYMDNQAEALLDHVNVVISEFKPGWPEPPARKSALLLMDGVLHDVYAPERPPVQQFFKKRIREAIDDIERSKITDGARIWKLYNDGFVVRTGSVTLGFDLVQGKSVGVEAFCVDDEDMKRLIDQCDVLFISHYHADHTEDWVAEAFLDEGKPVVAPPGVWKDKQIYEHMTHLERVPHTEQILPVQGGKQELKVVVYPGHQSVDIENNVYLVITPGGLSFSQMGDQSNDDDFAWIDEVGSHHDVDVLLPNCWTTDIVRVAKGFNPALMITGHENEMGHTIDHREPYWLTYQRRQGSDRFGGSRDVGYDIPLILMTWGESFHYHRADPGFIKL